VGEHKLDSDFLKHEINHRASAGEGLLSFSFSDLMVKAQVEVPWMVMRLQTIA
jgi:hypothetical protein